jgi:glycosyltransferase involved in cell wall biosynthesis
MKIVLATGIYPPETGGPSRRVPMLAKALVERGHTVSVVTYGDAHTEAGSGWNVAVVRRAALPFRYLMFFWKAFRLARKADVVLAQSPVSDGLPACLASKMSGKPFLLNVVGDYAWEIAQQRGEMALLEAFLERPHRGFIGRLERVERWVAGQACRIIVPSRYLATVVVRWGVEAGRVSVVYNAVDPAVPDADPTELRRSLVLPEGGKLILTNARAVPWKGVETLLQALKRLPATYHLAHIGAGPWLSRWKAMAETLEVDHRVHWLGTMSPSRVATWLQVADIFALASGYEGYPFVVAEALRAGVPCVVSDQAGNAEMGELYPQGVRVVPYQNAEAWADALSDVAIGVDPASLALPSFQGMVDAYEKLFTLCVS